MRIFLVCLCLWIGATAAAAAAEKRVALVIGNSDYLSAPQLKNPVTDATAIGAALGRLGFEVLLGTDLDTGGMRALVRDFSLKAEGSDLALFFYAGHGLQVAGRNYLIPVDAVLERESDLDFAAVDLQLVLKQLELASGNSVVLLDACRDNPFETRLSRGMGAARSSAVLGRGLAPVETVGGSLIGFATDPGEVAYDGDGDHSPFTEALLAHIETPGIEINTLMTRVRAAVVERTGQLQRPWSTSSLLDELYLAPAAAERPAGEDPVLADVESWKAADQEGSREAIALYLERFPDGLFAEMARDRLRELEAAASGTGDAPVALPDTDAEGSGSGGTRGGDDGTDPADPGCRLCPDLVALPGGGFSMGSVHPRASEAEGPVTRIALAPFRLSKGEITLREYRLFLDRSGYQPGAGCWVWTEGGRMRFSESAGWASPGFAVSDDMPVACVSWVDAAAYAHWLAAVTGLKVRLPSEAELEYAIRAGEEGELPFPGGALAACRFVNAADTSARFTWRNTACADGFAELAPAAAFPANGFGLLAITGNLWEWAADCWNPTHAGASPDGAARREGTCDSRVLRGGSWDDPVTNLRAAYRVAIPARRRQANVGFRVAIGD